MWPSRPRVLATVYKINRISLFPDQLVGSDLSPITAEYGSISACSTQNKAKLISILYFGPPTII